MLFDWWSPLEALVRRNPPLFIAIVVFGIIGLHVFFENRGRRTLRVWLFAFVMLALAAAASRW